MSLLLLVGGVAQQATPTPDTLGFMIAGYIVFWAIALIYILSLGSRERNLQKDLEALRQVLEEDRKESGIAERQDGIVPDAAEQRAHR